MIERPNRDKASSKAMKAIVVLILLVSVALMAIVCVGGWSKLQGAQPVLIAWMLVYLIMAFYIARWSRGALPMVAALGIVMGIFAAIAGPPWFDRAKTGFAQAQAIWGGAGLGADLLGLITLLIVPVQILLIAFAMYAFRQEWQVELEVPAERARRRSGGEPATA